MKNIKFLIIVITLGFSQAKADEGMWLPLQIKGVIMDEMQAYGLELSAEDIYSINNASIKDAIVSFGGFCTGEIISREGLLLTNHHCGYGALQSHSSVEDDILKNGFWAASKEDEKPNEGLYARFLVRMEHVTKAMEEGITNKMSEDEADSVLKANEKNLIEEATEGTHYTADVKGYFEDNEYYLLVYETYNDVRLVGAPPSSIGKFGGDTDNWMWPRHTGDFSLFRVYMSPDGKPAEYSPENIPLKPKHHLPVSLDGYSEGDFAMILGYPGSTNRYLTSFGIRHALDVKNKAIIDIRAATLDVLKEQMDSDPAIKIKYASKYASISNYWKYYIGQTKGLKRLKVLEKKQNLEKEFEEWMAKKNKRTDEYGQALAGIDEGYKKYKEIYLPYLYNYYAQGYIEINKIAGRLESVVAAFESGEDGEKATEKFIEYAKDFYKNFDAETDKKVFLAIMNLYEERIEASQLPDFEDMEGSWADIDEMADNIYEKTAFTSLKKVEELVNAKDAQKIKNDPAYKFYMALSEKFTEVYQLISPASEKIKEGNKLFVKGLRQMKPDTDFYPDANSTLRITYGRVLPYEPQDAVSYNFYTTATGIEEKEDPDNEEFIVPEKLMDLIYKSKYGSYGEDGKLFVNFITNHDITGGNSGSPVINGKGHLIGTAFDGNWEAMSGDIAFEPEIQRTISVDVRYMLFIIDDFAGASHLIDEMTLIKEDKEISAEEILN